MVQFPVKEQRYRLSGIEVALEYKSKVYTYYSVGHRQKESYDTYVKNWDEANERMNYKEHSDTDTSIGQMVQSRGHQWYLSEGQIWSGQTPQGLDTHEMTILYNISIWCLFCNVAVGQTGWFVGRIQPTSH